MNTHKTRMARITKQEVKTIYHITIGVDEIEQIMSQVAEEDEKLMKALGAFQFDWKIYTQGRQCLRQLLADLWKPTAGKGEVDTIRYIVQEIIGFDGVENYGLFNADTGKATMVVYNDGDRLN